MIRGTTPTHKFELPFKMNNIKAMQVIYAQADDNTKEYCKKIVKNTDDCKLEGNVISVNLTQEDTLSLRHGAIVNIQLRVLLNDGKCFVSNIIKDMVHPCLSDEVLV